MGRHRPRRSNPVDPTIGQLHRLPGPHHRYQDSTSRRAIDLDASTVAVLQQWKSRQLTELGVGTGDGAVFTRPDGQPVHPHTLSQTFHQLQRAAGVPAIRLHDLRHTHATLMLKQASR